MTTEYDPNRNIVGLGAKFPVLPVIVLGTPVVVRVNDWITKHLFIVFGLPILALFVYGLWSIVSR